MAKQIEKRYMKFEDFIDKYAWYGDKRYKYFATSLSGIGINKVFLSKIMDRYTEELILIKNSTMNIDDLISQMKKDEFAHLKKIYDLCFVKFKK